MKSESGSGGGCDIGNGWGIMETPQEQTKVTKETLQERMLQLQEDFRRLEEEELQDSPAQAVKKRKRRKSSGKGKEE